MAATANAEPKWPAGLSAQTAVALVLALASTALTNVAHLREHDAAAALPALSLRRPLHSIEALLTDRSWLLGFALERRLRALRRCACARTAHARSECLCGRDRHPRLRLRTFEPAPPQSARA